MSAFAGSPVLAIDGAEKRFGAVHALKGVSLKAYRGEVLALLGDNGAGKSTMLKLISGVHAPTSGHLEIDGAPKTFSSPVDATEAGITTVYQDLALSLQRDVADNFFLGRELISQNWLGRQMGWLNRAEMQRVTRARLAELRVRIKDMYAKVGDLSGGQRQALAIARAAAFSRSVLLLDEPTSALGVEQHNEVLELISTARDAGKAVILVSHQMPDILKTCDRVVVFRLGRVVANVDRSQFTAENLIAHITGAAAVTA